MAHQLSGEVQMTLGETSYRLRLTIGQIMDLEDYFDKGITEIITEANKGRMGYLSSLLAALMGKDFAQKSVREEAGALIQHYGRSEIFDKMRQCLQASLYDKKQD